MANINSFMAAKRTIKGSKVDFVTFLGALEMEKLWMKNTNGPSLSIQVDIDPHDNLFIYSGNFSEDDLSYGVCQAVGELLKSVGADYLEFAYCKYFPSMEPGSLWGGKFRIDKNGNLVWPKLVWS